MPRINLATSKINNDIHELQMLRVREKFDDGVNYKFVFAQIPTNFKFLCWVTCASVDWVGLVYNSSPGSQSGTFWRTQTEGEQEFLATYLVYR